MIDFSEIPQTRVPGTRVEISRATKLNNLPGKPSIGLILGQMNADSKAVPFKISQVTSSDQGKSFFGRGSECARMISAFYETNQFNALFCLPLKPETGTQAVFTLTATVNETPARGTFYLYIGGKGRLALDVTPITTKETLHTLIASRINANQDLPVMATVTDEKVTITAKAKGQVGNNIKIVLNDNEFEETPEGVLVVIEQTIQGSGNPDLSEAIAEMGDFSFTDIVNPYTDKANLDLLKDEMNRRYNAMISSESTTYQGLTGSFSEIITQSSFLNTEHMIFIESYGSLDAPEERAARLAGVQAFQAQMDPARQTRTLPLTGSKAPKKPLTEMERNLLLGAGVATTTCTASGDVLIERVITSLKTGSLGIPAEMDIETVKIATYMRFSYKSWFTKYPRSKLADDGYPVKEGEEIVTPIVLKGEAVALANLWYEAGLMKNIDSFIEQLVSVRDFMDTERVNQCLKPSLINNLRVLACKLEPNV